MHPAAVRGAEAGDVAFHHPEVLARRASVRAGGVDGGGISAQSSLTSRNEDRTALIERSAAHWKSPGARLRFAGAIARHSNHELFPPWLHELWNFGL